jgi:hypothetical protein
VRRLAQGKVSQWGLLTTDGKIYQVMGDLAVKSDAKVVPHMAQRVTLTEDAREEAAT